MPETRLTVQGLRILEFKLSKLAPRVAKKAIKKGTRVGSKMVTAKTKQLAPVERGQVRRAMKTRVLKSRRRSVLGTITTIGKGFFKGGTFYGAFVEFGYKRGKRGKPNRKEIPGQHFIERAVESVGRRATKTAAESIAKEIENALRV